MRYTLEDILAKMPGSHKQHGDEWETGCPVCGSDHHLYFKDNGGQILANCQHCGATLPKVLEAAGMKGGNGFTAGRHTGRFDFNATNQHQGQAKPKKAAKPKDHGRIIENTHRAHIYRNPDGTEAYWKDRKKYEDGHKEFYFFHSGADGEEVKGKPENCNNLYHLDELEQAAPDTPLYIVEGEKCVEAMAAAGFLATTTNRGAKAPGLSDTDKHYIEKFQTKIMIPDNDEPGRRYAAAWKDLGARVLDLSTIWPEIPEKGDIADYLAAGGDPEKIRNYQFPEQPEGQDVEGQEEEPDGQEEQEGADLEPDGGQGEELTEEYFSSLEVDELFSRDLLLKICAIKDPVEKANVERRARARAGAFHCVNDFKKAYKAVTNELGKQKAEQIRENPTAESLTAFTGQPLALRRGEWVCNDRGVRKETELADGTPKWIVISPIPVMPSALYENKEDGTEKIELAYSKAGRWRSFIVPRSDVANKNRIVALADKGLEVTTTTASSLVNYIADMVNLNRDKLPQTASIGHMGWTTWGEFVPYVDPKQLVLDCGDQYAPLVKAIQPRGTLEQWLEIVRPLLVNPNVRMIVAASLASALVGQLNKLPFIFHLWGGTEVGKTVALEVAASVWGNPGNANFVGSLNSTINYLMEKMAFLHSIPVFGDELQTIKEIGGNYDRLIYTVTEKKSRGRLKSDANMKKLLSWNNCLITNGEDPITQDNSGGGAVNRVIEVECKESLFTDPQKVVNDIAECYGVLGPAFTEWAIYSKHDNEVIYKQYVKDLAAANATGKQAGAAALMLTAYSLFQSKAQDVPMLTVEDVKAGIKTVQEVDVAERAYNYVVEQIELNRLKFYGRGNEPRNGEVWGKLESDRAIILTGALKNILAEKGYSLKVVRGKWWETGRLQRGPADRWAWTHYFGKYDSGNAYELSLPKPVE